MGFGGWKARKVPAADGAILKLISVDVGLPALMAPASQIFGDTDLQLCRFEFTNLAFCP